jgi:hypothetical protein
MSYGKIQKPMRKTHRGKGRNAKFYVINVTQATEQPAEFHIGEELAVEQRENFRSSLNNDFPELLHAVDSPHVSQQ